MKVLIFDSGTLINLSMNGLLDVLEELKKTFDGKFIITKEVKYETMERPIGVPRFELGALRIKHLLDSKVIESPSTINITDKEISKKTKLITNLVNKTVIANRKYINIVGEAEMSCLALSDILSKKGIENMVAVDERTARIIVEKPENLKKLMEKRLRKRIQIQTFTC